MIAQNGSHVKVAICRQLQDGTTIEDATNPMMSSFTIGEGTVLKGLDEAVCGMQPGEKKRILIEPEKAYGIRQESLVRKISRATMPQDFVPEKDAIIKIHIKNGPAVPCTIIDYDDATLTVDLNHPLADQAIYFTIEVQTVS